MIHELGDPGITTGDHRVDATGVMSNDDGVVDRLPRAGGLRCGGQISSLVHFWGV
jgi:hypothetical protein